MFDKLIDVAVQCVHFFVFWCVVDEYERGVLLRLGKWRRDVEPGLVWCIPFNIDRVLVDNVVTRTKTLDAQALTTLDGRTVSVTGVVTASIRHIRKALLDVENMDHALTDSCSAAISNHVAASNWDALRTDANNETLTKACRAQAWRYGIEIERVQLADLALCRVIRLHSTAAHGIAAGPI